MGIYHRVLLVLLCVLLGTQGHAMARHLEGHKPHQQRAHQVAAEASDDTAQNPTGQPLGKCVAAAQVCHVETPGVRWSNPPAFATPQLALPHTLALSHPVPDKPPRVWA